MSASTIWKIKNADPPRRVDIDEATAIAVGAFEYASIEAFLEDSPLESLRTELRSALRDLDEADRIADRAQESMDSIREQILRGPSVRESLKASERHGQTQELTSWAVDLAAGWRVHAEVGTGLADVGTSIAQGLMQLSSVRSQGSSDAQ